MTNATTSIAAYADLTSPDGLNDIKSALKFITCGSVDDGKSTLIGRLLVDSRSVMLDQLASVSKSGEADLAMFTDGLSAEREQGITIDVAYRYFSTPTRKFIIGDAPGHVQYTRNMVTAASSADAAVVLVDATKLQWQDPGLQLLPQTRRHSLLVNLLRVPGIVFAVNKLDAIADPSLGFAHIKAALEKFAREAGIEVAATVPISALKGQNVVNATPGWCGYEGPSLLHILELLPVTQAETDLPFSFSVQWVEKFSASSDTSQGRRVFWGKVASGAVRAGQQISILPSGQTAVVARVMNHVRTEGAVLAGHSAGIVLDREVDVSRGDWLLCKPADSGEKGFATSREIKATVAWLDDETLVAGRIYWALHGNRWVKAKVKRVVHKLNIENLAEEEADHLDPNAIGHIELALVEPIATLPFARSRTLGAMVLVDTASHKTSGAVLVQ
jgi:sulfate adenylyltransferase subunit 1